MFFSLCPSTPLTPHRGHQLLPLLSFPTWHTVQVMLHLSPCSTATVPSVHLLLLRAADLHVGPSLGQMPRPGELILWAEMKGQDSLSLSPPSCLYRP